MSLAAEQIGNGFSAPLNEHEVLVFLVQLALLVGLARGLGGMMRALGQPPVVGELLAGVLLGPSVFGRFLPGLRIWVFGSPTVESVMFGLAWLGVIMLLVVIGYETDLGIISRFRRAALLVSAGGLLLPLGVTFAAAFAVPNTFVGVGYDRTVFAGFFALAFSVAALPVVGKILQDLNLLRRNFGQINLAAGMTMDAVGWLLLAALSGIAQDGFDPVSLAFSFGGLALFLLVLVTAGRWMLDGVMRWVLDRGSSLTAGLTVAVMAALIGGIVTQTLRLEAILGAFLVGIVLATLRHQVPQVEHTLETVTASVFAPIFFAFSGLRVDIGLLDSAAAILWAVGLIVLAVTAKVVGVMIGSALAGIQPREGLALGSGLSALGAMGIVVAIVGLNLGVVTETAYTVMVLAAIVTSVLAPPALKLVVRGWEPAHEEKERLEREQLLEGSEILDSKRILLPTRGGRNSRYAARVITSVFDDPEVTVLVVDVSATFWHRLTRRGGEEAKAPDDVLAELGDVKHRVVKKSARDPAAAIGREARLGYDLVLLGASEEEREAAGVFSSVVDRVVASLDIPTVIVRFPSDDGADLGPPGRILVPVVASRASRAAEELAYSLVRRWGGRAYALHVVNRPDGHGVMFESTAIDSAVRNGQQMVAAAAAFGEKLGASVDTGVRLAPNPEAEIVEVANTSGYDLVVIGASNKPLTDRPFFGHRVTYMIEHSHVPIAVVTLPVARSI